MLRLLPKWLYVVLAVSAYVGLHLLNRLLVPAGIGAPGIGAQIATHITYWGQYLLPLLLLVAGLLLGRGEEQRTKAGRRLRRPSAGGSTRLEHDSVIKLNPFIKMSAADFHRLLTEFFSANGFAVEPIPQELGDGVDLMLSKGDKTFVAQYRHWREHRVDVPMVRQQYTVMQAARADGVYVITTGEFSYKAIQYAEDKNISLIDGIKLRRLVSGSGAKNGHPEAGKQKPTCPLCAAEMRIRTVADEEGDGRRFWRCTNYPKCSGTIDRVRD
ncbi:MAG: restriction endonuclease [Desulfofustis sp.]